MRASQLLPALGMLTACATPSVLLLDGEKGARVGAVAVVDESSGEDRALIDRANTRASIGRSEEHTSELQSLMRISYAVFCLKKKTKNKPRIISITATANIIHITRYTIQNTKQH